MINVNQNLQEIMLGLGVTQGHRKWYQSIDRLWLLIGVI